jgi:hypothetical protein
MKKVLALLAAAIMAAGTAAARANTVAYNQNVADDGGSPTPYLFFGTGNPNGHFTTDSNNGIVIGLRADTRFVGPIAPVDSAPGVTNLYNSTAGGGSLALWNYVYSIDVSGATDTNLNDYVATISITGPGGALPSYDAIHDIPDNDGPHHAAELANGVAQNSENIGFIGGNPNLAGLYTIDLTLKDARGAVVASDEIFVNAAPLPSAATMGLGMLALVGAAGLVRKKLRIA